MKTIKKLLVANRSEIAIRVFRSATELGIRTVAIFSHEDRFALHRFKADEAYQIGQPGEPIRSYLDIDNIVALAQKYEVDAIHPGYGFLAENPQFAQACRDAGIIFVGPSVDSLNQLGDKTAAREIAEQAGVPVLGGSPRAIRSVAEGMKTARHLGFPVMLKAAKGGGGRGMRVVSTEDDFATAFEQAQRESKSAFGSPDVFLERFVARARHIEVQIMGDAHGNIVHLYERDCSVQRRHQKVVEIAPAPNLDPNIRRQLCEAALSIGRAVNYENAGTVEFLLDDDTRQFYFIEVNPRIQVEHTVTEEVTGFDIVKTQILIAQGMPLDHSEIGMLPQESIRTHGFALQCRVTTEDPANGFLPDYGRVAHYRSAAGMGIRLDAGTAFTGAVVTPFYDSLLVKVTARGYRFVDAVKKMERSLTEFRVRGVKTNLPFLLKLLSHPTFLQGNCTTRFIDQTAELFQFAKRRDRASKILSYLGEIIVNGNSLVKGRPQPTRREPAPVPHYDVTVPIPPGSRQIFQKLGAEQFSQWILKEKSLMMTDTSFRDAHQSLFATRFRTYDMLKIAEAYARMCPELFSIEMWGGATFDTAMRFLKESPWQRLADLRERIPNILFQMLLRSSNAVGYTNYPDNVVKAFVKEAADAGMDVFRIFDALNWVPNMKVAMDAVIKSGAICEAAICYTGDILDTTHEKYSLKYYVDMAKELENMGAHILAIKDMAGVCKPHAAELLVKTLKQEVGIPIHFHTHDTGGIQAAAILKAADAKVDIADAAMAPLSGGTSQPNLNTIVEALRLTKRPTQLNPEHLDKVADYWRAVREYYTPFGTEMMLASADLYKHAMPGGQFTNLYEQARALGLSDRWSDVCRIYAEVNDLFGDIVKVTPTSKAVGDMALFMVANNLTSADILDENRDLSFPESVIDLISGAMGQPPGGFPKAVKHRILRDKPAFRGRPGASLPPAKFDEAAAHLKPILHRDPTDQEIVTHLLYEKVFHDYINHYHKYSDTSNLPTPVFFYGPFPGEELSFDIEPGKTLIVKFLTVGDPHPDGRRTVFFELNGQPRDVNVQDHSLEPEGKTRAKANPANSGEIGANMPGMVVVVSVKAGDTVTKGQKLLTLEAMKMETTIQADRDAKIVDVFVAPGNQVETGDLLMTME
ncbi:MAG: pyruvate carboxylase [Planctomycetaceae bacterium]